MTDREALAYSLADRLHQPVAVIKRLPASELVGWVRYTARTSEPDGKGPTPLDANDPQSILRAFKVG
jgi:hypothetical protein